MGGDPSPHLPPDLLNVYIFSTHCLKVYPFDTLQTVVEAFTVGVLVAHYDTAVVLQAFFLTATVVIGLTLYTFQSKRDFSGWGAG